MAYATYTTEAIVCGTFKRNTADASFLLFTREAGMLYADARSVREERSRQRYALQDFSRLRVSLVKGKVGWKIGSAEALENFYHDAPDRAVRGSVVSLIRFVRRFCQGESLDAELYDMVVSALRILPTRPAMQIVLVRLVEVRLLVHLGYVTRPVDKDWFELSLEEYMGRPRLPEDTQELDRLYTAAVAASQL